MPFKSYGRLGRYKTLIALPGVEARMRARMRVIMKLLLEYWR
jgi:hypothetical protein